MKRNFDDMTMEELKSLLDACVEKVSEANEGEAMVKIASVLCSWMICACKDDLVNLTFLAFGMGWVLRGMVEREELAV